MDKLSCEICMDLLPLVQDGIAGEESRKAVEEHLAACSRCRSCYEGTEVPHKAETRRLMQLKKQLRGAAVMILLFGIFFGLLQTNKNPFINSILMPVIGALSYFALGAKAFWATPLLLAAMNGLMVLFYGTSFWIENGLFIWTLFYIPFALLGTVLALLYCCVFQKKKKTIARAAVLVLALLLTGGIGLFANALVGNPVSRLIVTQQAKSYLAQHYSDTDYQMNEVNYSFKDGSYLVKMESPSSEDGDFSVNFSAGGRYLYDNYEERVTRHGNTDSRLYMEYRALGDRVLKNKNYPYQSEDLIAFTDLMIPQEKKEALLVADKAYDIPKLGAEYGVLHLIVRSDTVSTELAAEVLCETKRQMDEAGVPFRAVNFTLCSPTDAPVQQKEIKLENFPAEELDRENLAARIEEASVSR